MLSPNFSNFSSYLHDNSASQQLKIVLLAANVTFYKFPQF